MISYDTHGMPRPVGSEFRQRMIHVAEYDERYPDAWRVSVVDTLRGPAVEAVSRKRTIVATDLDGHTQAVPEVLGAARELLDEVGWTEMAVRACDVTGCDRPLPMWRHGLPTRERRECLACAVRTVLACRECGAPCNAQYDNRERLLATQTCFRCHLWSARIADGIEIVTPNWVMYSIGPGTGPKDCRGHGGARCKVTFTDGRVVETDDLWNGGEIPEWFRDRVEPNATVEFVQGAAS